MERAALAPLAPIARRGLKGRDDLVSHGDPRSTTAPAFGTLSLAISCRADSSQPLYPLPRGLRSQRTPCTKAST